MEPEILEAVLRHHSNDNAVVRVLSVDSQPAVAKGENYLSTINSVTAKVVLGDGRTTSKSMILKVVPLNEARRNYVSSLGVFKAETDTYISILQEMEALMEEFQDNEDILWGRLLHHHPYDCLLFEDLKVRGFMMCPRQSCLDLEHGQLVLHNIGRFHGMAKVLEHRGVLNAKDIKPFMMSRDKSYTDFIIHKGLQALSKAMEESWGAEWGSVAKKLRMPLKVFQEKILSADEVDESRFNVFNHGDLWTTNMMFKYDWKKRPIAVRFLDFQVGHYNSPAWDLTYLMYTTIEPSLRRKHYDSLLRTYSEALLTTLQKFQYPGRHPTHEELIAEMERVKIFALAVGCVHHAVMTADTTEAIDLEEVIASRGESGHKSYIYNTESYKLRIGPDLLKYEEEGLI